MLDVAKGFGPALAGALAVGDLAGVAAGGAAMVGHWRPLFLGFAKGGKKVATAGGTLLGVAPVVGLVGACVWLLVCDVGRYASLASILAALALPAVAIVMDESCTIVAFTTAADGAVVVLHRANIRRLRAGTETRFRFRRRAAARP